MTKKLSVVNVLVDSATRLGALSYLVPEGLTVTPGDAVHVPFGKRTAYGVALGAGDATKATREVIAVFGRRVHPADVETADELARRHLCDVEKLVPRFAPKSAKGAEPIDAGVVELTPETSPTPMAEGSDSKRILAWCQPGVDRVRFAATRAAELAEHGQVLVLCPTVAGVSAVLSNFVSGAARLDAAASRGAWSGFVNGTVTVGVGTRAAALYSPSNLAGIIVLDPEHPGHVEAAQPHTHARDVALLRAENYDVPLIMVSSICEPTCLAQGVKLHVAAGEKRSVRLLDRTDTTNGSKLVPNQVQIDVKQASKRGPVCVVAPGRTRLVCTHCSSTRECREGHHPTQCSCEFAPCSRCGTTTTKPSGWDAVRLQQAFATYPDARNIKCVPPEDLPKTHNTELTVVLDADSPTKSASLQPEVAQLRLLQAAASSVRPGGTLTLLTQDAEQPLIAKFAAGDLRGVARVCYQAAKSAGLPPFGRLVLVRAARANPPSCASWPGRVHGPRQVAPGEWEVLVRCSDADLPLLRAPLERLRRSAKLRITVS